jgi:hypothetical protein
MGRSAQMVRRRRFIGQFFPGETNVGGSTPPNAIVQTPTGLLAPSAPIQPVVTTLALPAVPTAAMLSDQQTQANNAIAAGMDPGLVATLVSLGATGPDLALAAQGQWNPGPAVDPNTSGQQLLDYLTGNSPVPGAAITSAGTFPQTDVTEQGFGPLSPDQVATAAAALTPGTGTNLLLIGGLVLGGGLLLYFLVRK